MTGPEIVKHIEDALKQKGISKTKFYSECNVTSSMMSNWRRGKNLPLMDTMSRINRFLGTDLVLTSFSMTETERVCAICHIKGVPVSGLEQHMGYPDGYLDPTATKELPYADLMKIAAYFNLPISNLIYGPLLPNEKSPAPVDGDEAERQELIQILSALDPAGKETLLTVGRSLKAAYEAQGNGPKSP